MTGNAMTQQASFQDSVIREHAAHLSFIDFGGLWGTLNEKVTVASLAGARSTAIADMQPRDNYLWRDFRKRCADLGVSGYAEHIVNLDDPHLREKIGAYDFVHCSGIIYHAPSPLLSIAQLRSITNRYLLIGSMVVPERVDNAAGSLDFTGGTMLFLPAIDAGRHAIMARHFDASGIRIAPINAERSEPFWLGGAPNYSPWWWLYSASTLRAMLEVSGFMVLNQGSYWSERVSYCFCERTDP
jgi:hypothetical protein